MSTVPNTRAMRDARADDLAAITALLRASDLPTVGVAEVLRAHPSDFVVVEDIGEGVAEAGRLLAVAGLEVRGEDALLRSVAVRADARASGVGRALVERVLERAESRGLRALYLLTTTAERYFPKFGFAPIARDDVPDAIAESDEFRGACPASAVAMMRRTPTPFRVLVLCTGNSARSQIAEALLATRGATRTEGRVIAASAGSRPAARVNPYAEAVLHAHGIAWSDRAPKHVDDVAAERYDLVITVCDNAREACPYFPGAVAQVHWGLPDPADEHEPDAARRAFGATFDALASRIDALLALPLTTLAPNALRDAAQRVHDERLGHS